MSTERCSICGRAHAQRLAERDAIHVQDQAEIEDLEAELSRIEGDLLAIHDALESAGHKGSINADSIIERIERITPASKEIDRRD